MEKYEFSVCPTVASPLVVGSTVFRSITDFELTEDELRKARIELGESEETVKTCLEELKRKLSKAENVRYRTDYDYLLRYLRVRKFNCDRAYEHLKLFHRLKKNTDFFSIPRDLRSGLDRCCLTVLPYTDEEGRVIFWVDYGKWKPEEVPFEEEMAVAFILCDRMMTNPRCQVNGCICVADMRGFGISHISATLRRNRIWTFAHLMQYCYPWRVKYLIAVNTGMSTRFIYNLMRPLITKKRKDRLFLFGSDMSELHQYINPAILPKELGGQLEGDRCNPITKLVLENTAYLEYERSF